MALDGRYRWEFEVTDVIDRPRVLSVGVDVDAQGRSHVIVNAPAWYKADPDVADQIAAALQAAGEQARKRRRS